MDHFLIWNTVSMAWTEIGLDDDEYPAIARELRRSYESWEAVDTVIRRDVLGSFALESGLFPLALVPVVGLLLIAPFPDWGYDEDYLRQRMRRWHRMARWRQYLNPVRLLGYPIAWLFSLPLRRRLERAWMACG
ncbi:hypothetical protein [Marilutibacter maris]|uniref:Uncharacterized protein n=1 Tax=Marilutibacter maris TaxID=1605891 RepID=A0A2U9T594_9GAMM|nr:hypothetical protein [Lysobacter maris]AWV06144.1 hypothetical protein C9I47_0420 [Lysobacter maris]